MQTAALLLALLFLPAGAHPALTAAQAETSQAAEVATQARTPQVEVAAHVAALRAQVADLRPGIDTAFAAFVDQLDERLDDAVAANDAGLLFAALGILRDLEPAIAGVAFHGAHAADITTREAHAALSDELEARLAERAAAIERHGWQGRPLLVRAMGQASLAAVPTQVQGGRAFGADVGDFIDGLFQLGIAEGTVAFADWLSSLPLRASAPEPALAGLAAQVARLDREVLAAYEDPAAQIDQHPAFIRASSALKVVAGLAAQRLPAAELLTYLDAERAFGEVVAAGAPAADVAALAGLEEQLAARLAAAGVDHSVADRYLQLARFHLARAGTQEAEEATTSVAAAAVLLQRVVPRYLDVVTGTATTDAPDETASGEPVSTVAAADAEVTVTLVRWPFT